MKSKVSNYFGTLRLQRDEIKSIELFWHFPFSSSYTDLQILITSLTLTLTLAMQSKQFNCPHNNPFVINHGFNFSSTGHLQYTW